MPITLTTQLDPAALRRAMAERGIDNRTLIADSGLSPTTLQKALRGDRIGVKAAAAIEHAVNAHERLRFVAKGAPARALREG